VRRIVAEAVAGLVRPAGGSGSGGGSGGGSAGDPASDVVAQMRRELDAIQAAGRQADQAGAARIAELERQLAAATAGNSSTGSESAGSGTGGTGGGGSGAPRKRAEAAPAPVLRKVTRWLWGSDDD
jgi:hypothetical protein